MMLAQLSTILPAELGSWLVALCAVMAVYWLARQIYLSHFPPPPPPPKQEDLYVTHAQFDTFKLEYRRDLAELRTEIRRDLEKAAADWQKQVAGLDHYTRDAFHRQANAQQTMMNDLAYIKGTMDAARPRVPAETT